MEVILKDNFALLHPLSEHDSINKLWWREIVKVLSLALFFTQMNQGCLMKVFSSYSTVLFVKILSPEKVGLGVCSLDANERGGNGESERIGLSVFMICKSFKTSTTP